MFRGVYSAATGMLTASQSQDVTAHNLAHGTVPGYLQHGVVQETFEQTLLREDGVDRPLIGSRVARQYTDFRRGGVRETGTPLDLAMQGNDTFFAVQSPNGTLYTRDGVLQKAVDGTLVNTAGYPILGQGGPVRVPPQAGTITVTGDGSVLADNNPIDRLQVTRFRNPARLESAGTALFRSTNEAGQEPAAGGVLQGYRELSNVQYPNAMVEMIRELRYYEAAQRALRTISDSVSQVTRPV